MSEESAQTIFGPHFETINQYVDILLDRGIAWGLLGPQEGARLWDRHIVNSVALSPLISEGASVVDVGSGAGLPGLPLAILRPDLEITLLEPLLRRSTFLSQVVQELSGTDPTLQDRVCVVRARAEDHRASYDVVTARAVARLDRLVDWCAPLIGPAGILLALKGAAAADEVNAARGRLDARGLSAEVLKVPVNTNIDPVTMVKIIRG